MSRVVHPLLGNFILIREIGHGSFATVFLARHEATNMFVALKVFDNIELSIEQVNSDSSTPINTSSQFMISEEQQQEIDLIKREVHLMQDVWHPLVVNLFDCFQDQGQVMFLSEIIDGDNLLNYVNNNGALEEDQARIMFAQMLLIMDYVHGEKKIVHRDLKCENFIVDKNNNIHLIDFGFAKSFATDRENVNALLLTTCGSPGYVAPEIIRNRPYDASVDIWSLGVILYAITHGQLPFDEASTAKLLSKVVNSEPQYDAHLSPELIDIIKQMLKKDPRERPTLEALKKHKWITTDQEGSCFSVNDKAFKKFVNDTPNSTNGGNFEIDQQTLTLLGFTPAQKEQVFNDLKNKEKTQLSLLYKIARKARVQDEIKNAPKMIFTPVSRNPPQRFHTFGPVSGKYPVITLNGNEDPDVQQLRQSQLAISQYPQQKQQGYPPQPQLQSPQTTPSTVLNLSLSRTVKKRQTRTPASSLATGTNPNQILTNGTNPIPNQQPPNVPAPPQQQRQVYNNIPKTNSSNSMNFPYQKSSSNSYRYSDLTPLSSNLAPPSNPDFDNHEEGIALSNTGMSSSDLFSSTSNTGYPNMSSPPAASAFPSGQLPKSYQLNSKHYTACSRRASIQLKQGNQVMLVTPQANPAAAAMNKYSKRKNGQLYFNNGSVDSMLGV
ncbi:hypothetical protein M9Y10_010412 [Tritrichomonas musculus]|uniref:Protein kinase domain-containing protein n=1 Tax=Tritrichomonas musculus TaxID=1915356 RepID=A0ABR2IKU7_9EUKA